MNYQQQAIDFANKVGLKLSVKYHSFGKYFGEDDQPRHIFQCAIRRGGKSYGFKFGQSIAKGSTEPTMYDVLACLTKYDPYSFEDFCSEYGYEIYDREDKRRYFKIYNSVAKEWKGVDRVLGDVIEELREIN